MKYYAVKKGRVPGIYISWDETKKQINGFSGAVYKSFASKREAENFLSDYQKINTTDGIIAYVDGSFHPKKHLYGYGAVLIEGQKVIKQFMGKGDHPDYVSMRNVAGEIAGSQCAVSWAIRHGYEMIVIYYDYMGIEKWATGEWQAHKTGTKAYALFMQEAQKKICIEFVKVLAHSGDTYNELADQLAKKAVGL